MCGENQRTLKFQIQKGRGESSPLLPASAPPLPPSSHPQGPLVLGWGWGRQAEALWEECTAGLRPALPSRTAASPLELSGLKTRKAEPVATETCLKDKGFPRSPGL